ncbi:MAG: nucleotidyltransferase family protein [Planctomycetota bacterium]|nr:nucleotidyltransferase family protein [Planctomycetota bacterium]
MKALILAAGYGTRLYPLTRELPKPLLGVGGVSIIDHILVRLEKVKGLSDVVVVTNSKFYERFLYWGKALRSKMTVTVLDDGTTSDDDRLGAIGDIGFSLRTAKITDDLLVVAGDNLFEFDLNAFARFGKAHGATVGVVELGSRELATKYGVVALRDDGRIASFDEKPPMPKSSLVSSGIYFYPRQQLARIEEYLATGQKADAPGYLIEWLLRSQDVFGYVFKGMWFDIGDIESYNKANDIYYSQKE